MNTLYNHMINKETVDKYDKTAEDIIREYIENSSFDVFKYCGYAIFEEFGCMVLMCQLPNGYVITHNTIVTGDLESDIRVCLAGLMPQIITLLDYEYTIMDADKNECDEESKRDIFGNEMNYDNCPYFNECFEVSE